MTVAEKPAKRLERTYSTEEIQRGLIAVAANNGNAAQAERELVAAGQRIPEETLRRWKNRVHPEEYDRLRAELLPKVQARAAEQYMEVSELYTQAAAKMAKRLYHEIDEIPARDLAGAARNTIVTAATGTDKALLLTGQPTQRIEKSGDEAIRSIEARLGILGLGPPEVIEGTAVEDAELG